MEFRKDKNVAASISMIEGAIFMSNRKTKKECLARKLFGLPHSQASFVKQLKSGMILFLFEYEERKLFGVFEAVSDGALNIEPNAFNKSGKPFTAQIRFQRIWSCYPLSEPEFSGAIKDNYYTTQKFHLHLSQEQVSNLLLLFSAKRICVQRPRVLNAGNNVLEQAQEHAKDNGRTSITSNSVANELSVDDVAQPANFSRHLADISGLDVKILNHCGQGVEPILNREDSIGKQSVHLPVSFSLEPSWANFTPSMSQGDGVTCDLQNNTVHGHHFYREDDSFHYTQQSPHVHGIDAFSWGSRDIVLPSSRSHLRIKKYTLDPSSIRHESLGIPVNQSGHRVSSILDHRESSGTSIHSLGTGYLGNRSIDSKSADYIDLAFIDNHEISGASIPFAGTRYIERRDMNSSHEYGGHRDLSLIRHSEPSRSTVPFLQTASFREKSTGHPSFMCSPSKNLLKLSDQEQSPAFFQNEKGCVREISGPYEALETASCLSGDGLTSSTDPTQCLGCRGQDLPTVCGYEHALNSDDYAGMGHYSTARDSEYHSLQSGLSSDHHENRPSVFSRLSAAVASSFQPGGSNESDAEISIDALTRILSQRRKERRKSVKYCKPPNQRIRKGQTNSELVMSVQINEEDLFVDEETTEVSIAGWRSPFLNFKRRSQVRKMHEGEGGHVEAQENEEPSSGRKRRKLIRPPLVPGEHFDKAITDAKGMELPVENDRRGESGERNLLLQAGSDRAVYPNDNRDGGEKLASLSNQMHANTTGQSQVLSDLLESARESEKSASDPSLELQTNHISSFKGETHVECLCEGNSDLLKPSDSAQLIEAASKKNEDLKITFMDELAMIEDTDGKIKAEGFLEQTGIENAEWKSESLEEDHRPIEAGSENNDLQKMTIDDRLPVLENVVSKTNAENLLEETKRGSEACKDCVQRCSIVSLAGGGEDGVAPDHCDCHLLFENVNAVLNGS